MTNRLPIFRYRQSRTQGRRYELYEARNRRDIQIDKGIIFDMPVEQETMMERSDISQSAAGTVPTVVFDESLIESIK
eukprot:snap_masked-scaffold_46-processed-gene-1.22-mRNA-1 protein AED:1.00 eAED:1.00 QI:0/0/0/0/1/1/2/0/76